MTAVGSPATDAIALRYNFGTTEREKNGTLLPKRHQIKHLEFVVSQFGTRGSEVQILSPRPYLVDSVDSILAVSASF